MLALQQTLPPSQPAPRAKQPPPERPHTSTPTFSPRSINFTATSSPVLLSRINLATPKLPEPMSLICGAEQVAGLARVELPRAVRRTWEAPATGPGGGCTPPQATHQLIFAAVDVHGDESPRSRAGRAGNRSQHCSLEGGDQSGERCCTLKQPYTLAALEQGGVGVQTGPSMVSCSRGMPVTPSCWLPPRAPSGPREISRLVAAAVQTSSGERTRSCVKGFDRRGMTLVWTAKLLIAKEQYFWAAHSTTSVKGEAAAERGAPRTGGHDDHRSTAYPARQTLGQEI